MKDRLELAKELLSEDGVIFVSIDDTEQAYLKVLMDDIFGEENFVSNIIWQKKNDGSGDDSKHLKNLVEYILIYTKNINHVTFNKLSRDVNDGTYKLKDEFFESRGFYKLKQLDMSSLTWSQGLDFEINYEGINYYAGSSSKKQWEERKIKHAEKDWQWRWSKEKFLWGIENKYIVIKNNKIYSKQYQYVDNNNQLIERFSPFSNLVLNKEISESTGTS
ncbi:conserved hypothetical protein [Mycoplasmopsis alligatoris A21JP2]|uniref:DNA methylase N-4/N-6 domain-containing protein n=2 Tax=Mycoplasmopsis alligatoris TaxID=47687 RepID=D4XVZ2_9BACT|nr:conserved hypothetical protein [Mycoplasmopsis alligatoris A21JP2]